MNARIATGLFALALMFAGTAQAGIPEDGLYTISNNSGNGASSFELRLEKVGTRGKDGIFLIHTGEGGSPAFLSAESSNDGATVDFRGSNETHWVLIENSNGWSFHHEDNGANCLSKTAEGRLRLRRANAGGRGNLDQLWKLKLVD